MTNPGAASLSGWLQVHSAGQPSSHRITDFALILSRSFLHRTTDDEDDVEKVKVGRNVL